MSYDVQVWSVRPFGPSALRNLERWQHPVETQWIYPGSTWQISICGSSKVLQDDVPEEIANALPGINYLTELNLEGLSTNEARELLPSNANHIAKELHGVIFDPQEGTTRTPAGVKRVVPPAKQETFSVLSFSWWFLESSLLSCVGLETFVSLFEKLLPETVPKRYGLYEPPQHVYTETGKPHLLQFLEENAFDMKVWYPHGPVSSVYWGSPSRQGPAKWDSGRVHFKSKSMLPSFNNRDGQKPWRIFGGRFRGSLNQSTARCELWKVGSGAVQPLS